MITWTLPERMKRVLRPLVAGLGAVATGVLLCVGLSKGWPEVMLWLTWALCAATMTAACLLLISGRQVKLHRLFLLFGTAIGLLFMLLLTPLSPPDEQAHYNMATQLTDAVFFGGHGTGSATLSQMDGYTGHHNTLAGLEKLPDDLLAAPDNTEQATLPYTPGYYVGHLPALPLMALVRALGGNAVQCLYAGRLACLLFYLLLTALAIRVAPRFKLALCVVGLMPMCLHQAASLSYDAYLMSMGFLTIALMIRAMGSENKRHEFLWAAAALTALAPAKVIYAIALLPLMLLIPAKSKGRRAWRFALTAVIVVGAGMLPNLLTLTSLANSTGNAAGCYTMADVLGNPLQTVVLFWNTLCANYRIYYMGCIGRYVSGMSIILPVRAPILFVMALGLTLFAEGTTCTDKRYGLVDRWPYRVMSLLCVGAMICAVLLTMMIAWTNAGAPTIDGVQGRYFILAVPLLVSALTVSGLRRPESRLSRWLERYGMYIAAAAVVLAALASFLICRGLFYATLVE